MAKSQNSLIPPIGASDQTHGKKGPKEKSIDLNFDFFVWIGKVEYFGVIFATQNLLLL
jgi:hypothetical protein